MVESLFGLGCREVSLGDTIGHGTPDSVARMLQAVLDVAPPDRLAGHFHDTKGRALDNVEVALDYGLRVFDARCGGLGGCPYAPGAKGNVATERVVARLEELGFATGLDRRRLAEAAAFARGLRIGGMNRGSAEIHRLRRMRRSLEPSCLHRKLSYADLCNDKNATIWEDAACRTGPSSFWRRTRASTSG